MFDSPAIAEQYFVEHFAPTRIEMLVEALSPAIVFKPIENGRIVIGSTRIGGTPDLPPDIEWPRILKPANAEEIAARGSAEAGAEMMKYFGIGLPYTFFAQIDLAEAASLGPVAANLPQQGRLLFFYDLMTGPWDVGTRTAKVMWDQAPHAALKTRPLPDALVAEDAAYKKYMIESAAKSGLAPPSPKAGTPFAGPARPMQLRATLQLPHQASAELNRYPTLKATLEDQRAEDEEEFGSTYNDMFERRLDPYYDATNSLHWQQLLGGPLPVQDDPRYNAVVVSTYGVQHLTPEKWQERRAEIERLVSEWRLLLQIDLSDLQQERTEGAVYFLIRDEDLKARRFDRVIGVYQQT